MQQYRVNTPTLLILGGYGSTGRLLARLLLQETDAHLVIAGRSLDRAQQLADNLCQQFSGGRVSSLRLDAADPAALQSAFQSADMVIVASSTARFAEQTARAALHAGCDYLDVQYSTQKINTLKSLAPLIQQSGRCFITDAGFHPGLPAALICLAAMEFDILSTAEVGSVIKENWRQIDLPLDTAVEMVEEFGAYLPLKLEKGAWVRASWTDLSTLRKFDFGPPFGLQSCAAMFLEEMRSLPELFPHLTRAGFYVGGFNPFVDWIVLPLAVLAARRIPSSTRPLARLLKWSLERFSRPPFGTVLKLEAAGTCLGEPHRLHITLSHPDGYWFTAAPAAACLLQVLDGSMRKPGLWTQAHLVDPARLLTDLKRMGINLTIQRG